MLLHLLPGLDLPPTLPLLGGHVGAWLAGVAGVAPDAARQTLSHYPTKGLGRAGGGLPPSVRCGLEAALLSAMATACGTSLASLLRGGRVSGSHAAAGLSAADEAGGPGGPAGGRGAAERGTAGSLAATMAGEGRHGGAPSWGPMGPGLPAVAVNGLVACEGASACAAEAARLVAQGFTTLKIKVRTLPSGCPSPCAVCPSTLVVQGVQKLPYTSGC